MQGVGGVVVCECKELVGGGGGGGLVLCECKELGGVGVV